MAKRDINRLIKTLKFTKAEIRLYQKSGIICGFVVGSCVKVLDDLLVYLTMLKEKK